jgi:hypothetical protein
MANVTFHDVAKYAGVSGATVSRVLNNNPRVDAELRSRVLEAIQVLGYQPNCAARRLRAQSSSVIGIVIPDIQNPYFLSVIWGVEDAAYVQQMNVILCNSDEDPAKENIDLQVMKAEQVASASLSSTLSAASRLSFGRTASRRNTSFRRVSLCCPSIPSHRTILRKSIIASPARMRSNHSMRYARGGIDILPYA